MRTLYIVQLKERWNVSTSVAVMFLKKADNKLWQERMRVNEKFSIHKTVNMKHNNTSLQLPFYTSDVAKTKAEIEQK